MAGRTVAGSSRSPEANSMSRPARWKRGLVGRTRARTANPRSRSLRATAEPTKPLAPVTRTVSPVLIGPALREGSEGGKGAGSGMAWGRSTGPRFGYKGGQLLGNFLDGRSQDRKSV